MFCGPQTSFRRRLLAKGGTQTFFSLQNCAPLIPERNLQMVRTPSTLHKVLLAALTQSLLPLELKRSLGFTPCVIPP